MASALEPHTIRGLTLPNKVAVAPMCTWMADPETNEPNERHLIHYGSFAMGGAGLVIVEAAPVEYRGRISIGDVGIWTDRQIPGWRRINDFIHKNTQSKTGIQLAHCGRKGNGRDMMTPWARQPEAHEEYGAESIGPSGIEFGGMYKAPKEASLTDLAMVKEAFVSAAKRAVESGFDLIEIHGAHGYFLCSFTSPFSNRRTDHYGGSLENRLRYPLEVVEAVRAVMSDSMPLLVRISGTEWVDGGLSVEDNIVFASELVKRGADVIHVSSAGNLAEQKIPREKKFQIPIAARIRQEAGVPVMAVGDIETLTDAADVLENGKADLVAVGRAFMRDAYWLRNEATRLGIGAWRPDYQQYAYGSMRRAARVALEQKLREADTSIPTATVQ